MSSLLMLLLVGILLPSPEHIFTETDVITNACENGGSKRKTKPGDASILGRWKLFTN